MSPRAKSRGSLALALSLVIHLSITLSIYQLPRRHRDGLSTVDILISRSSSLKPTAPKLIPPPEEPEPEFVPAHKLRPTRRKPPQIKSPRPIKAPDVTAEAAEPPPALTPDADKTPPETPDAKPVFDLGDNTFAASGAGAGWSLNRSEGNTKFASVAKAGATSLRNTKPKGVKDGVPGGTGDGPVRAVDLSRRPMPISGGFRIPPYPIAARKDGIEGEVILKVYIDKTGRVRSVRVVREPGGGLGETAKKSMLSEKWTAPLDRQGRPVATIITYKYTFELTG